MKFTKVVQIKRTIDLMQANKKTKLIQYPNAMKKMVVEYVEEERAKAEAGLSDQYISKGKFSVAAIAKELGMVHHTGRLKGNGTSRLIHHWMRNYDKYVDIDCRTDKGHTCSVARFSSENYLHAKQQALGTIAKETSALLSLRENCKVRYLQVA